MSEQLPHDLPQAEELGVKKKKPKTLPSKRGFRPGEAAEYIGVSEPQIWKLIKAGTIRHGKLSQNVTILLKEDLDEYLERAIVPPKPQKTKKATA